MAIFDPPQNPHPLTDHQKIWHRWLHLRPLRLRQIWYKSVDGALLGKWVKYNEIFFYLFIPFFINLPTGQTRRRIFTLDGSNVADSRKDVPFGGFVDIAPHFRGEIHPKTPIFGAWIGVFKPNGQNIESFKLLHPFQLNFAQRWRPSSDRRGWSQ